MCLQPLFVFFFNRIIGALVGILSYNGHVLDSGFKLLVRKVWKSSKMKMLDSRFSLLLTEDVRIVELFVSHPHAEPASQRIIRVLLTSIQKETGRERTWDWEGKKPLYFFCCQKQKKQKYTKINFYLNSLCVKKQSLFHTFAKSPTP